MNPRGAVHLFYNMFLYQMPIVHIATFTIEGKPPVLLAAMQACGALYVKTAGAAQFINHTLKNAREQLLQEFVRHVRFFPVDIDVLILYSRRGKE